MKNKVDTTEFAREALVTRDLSSVALGPGDFLVINDPDTQDSYDFLVESAVPDSPDKDYRAYRVRVLDSTNPGYKPGNVINDLRISKVHPTLGSYIRRDEALRAFDRSQIEKIAIVEIRKLIDSKLGDGKNPQSVSFHDALTFLDARGLYSGYEKDAKGQWPRRMKDRLAAAIRNDAQATLASRGGRIFPGKSLVHKGHYDLEHGIRPRDIIEVDMDMLSQGLAMVLNSFSCVKVRYGSHG